MDFDIHEDARTEGVALGAAPFLMCGWKARREEVRVTVPERAKPMSVDGRTGFIFLNRDGLPRVGGDYDRVFRGLRRKYAKGGGVPLPEDMTPHTLRHTFCTEMAKAGMNPKALQYIMGHKDIKMTLGYYAHMDGCTAAEEMRRVAV